MTDCFFAVADTETGGLDVRHNPLLSVSVLAVTPQLQVRDRFYIRLLPPEGTLLEVPEDPNFTGFNPRISHYELKDGTEVPRGVDGRPVDPVYADALVIQAGAAKVNGFNWPEWKASAIPREQADASFVGFMKMNYPCLGRAVAHNADFDKRFFTYNLPETTKLLEPGWLCTMRLLQRWRKKTGNQGKAKLIDLATLANEDPTTPAYQVLTTKSGSVLDKAHDALADTVMCHAGLVWLTAKLTAADHAGSHA